MAVQVPTSYLSSMLYGEATDQGAKSGVNPTSQTNPETFQVSATANARSYHGPQKNGQLAFHYFNAAASGATSALTVWYSNLPAPDPAVDAHWVQDTNIAPIDMTTTNTGTFVNVGNVNAEWIRFKPNVVTSAGTGWMWVRVVGPNDR